MIPFRSERQIRLYGQLLVNFANAKNSDEASKELIKGIQQAFNFPMNFVKQSENVLPSLKKFKSDLSKSEMVIIKNLLAEDDIIFFLNEEFESNQRELVDYNSTQNTITFQQVEWDADHDGDMLHGFKNFSKPPYTISLSGIEQTKSISKIKSRTRPWDIIEPEIIDELKKLMKIGNDKAQIIKEITKERYLELKHLAVTYEEIDRIHNRISYSQKKLRTTLNVIANGKSYYNNKNIKEYLEEYCSNCRLDLTIQPDDSFSYDSEFLKENFYLKGHRDFDYDEELELYENRELTIYSIKESTFLLPITYFLIEFILNYDRRKLKCCPYCDKFFIAKSINRKTRCYKPDCEKAYQRYKKRKQREKEPDIYY